MKQAINIRLDRDILDMLDHYALELDKTRTSLIQKSIIPIAEVYKKAGIDV